MNDPRRVGGGKIDLVDDRHYLQTRVNGEIGVGECLGFNALACVDDQYRALTRGEGTGYLVIEVDVTGGVYQIEGVQLAVRRLVIEGDGVGFDGNAAFPFKLHVVKDLILHLALADGIGFF